MRDATSAKHGSFHTSLEWSKREVNYTFHLNLAIENDFKWMSTSFSCSRIWKHMICLAINGYPAFMEFLALMPGLLLTTVECCRGTTTLDLTNGRILERRWWVLGGYFEDVCVTCCCVTIVIWRHVHRGYLKEYEVIICEDIGFSWLFTDPWNWRRPTKAVEHDNCFLFGGLLSWGKEVETASTS